MYSLGSRNDHALLETSNGGTGMAYLKGILGLLRGRGTLWYVDANSGNDVNDGKSWGSALKTLGEALNTRCGEGDTVLFRGNFTEVVDGPVGVPHVTIVGMGNRCQHADTHPATLNLATNSWRATTTNSPLLTIRSPGWRLENILFAAHASNYAIKLERNAKEDATEEDASHLTISGCRFASGAGGITDVGGTFNVRVENCIFQALTAACILGVGNIGVGQLGWEIINNRFTGFTNGVKIAAHECRIEGNTFTDGGTPGTTFVLNTNNGGGRDNFVVNNFFQTATANFNDPDVVGCATDVWNNTSIDGTADMIGREVGTPA
jgi:hypothetical protein